MIAEEDRRVEGLVETLHHVHRLEVAGEDARALERLFRINVAHGGVGVIHQNLLRPRDCRRAANRAQLSHQEAPAHAVIGASAGDLVPVDDPGHTLDICGYVYLQGMTMSLGRAFRLRMPSSSITTTSSSRTPPTSGSYSPGSTVTTSPGSSSKSILPRDGSS